MDWAHVAAAAANITTTGGLLVAGACALVMAAHRANRSPALPPLLALVTGGGLIALALDEGFELHDRVGRWLWNERDIGAPGPVNHVDDLIVIGYLAVGLIVLAFTLPTVLRSRRLVAWIGVAGVALASGTALDAFGNPGTWTEIPEEALEGAGALLLAVAFGQEAFARAPVPLPSRGALLASGDDLADFEPTVPT